MPTHPLSRLPPRSASQRLVFDYAPICGRSVAWSRIAVRRTAIHLLARLAIAASCTSSAAAFDAVHVSRMAGVIVNRSRLLELRYEARPNCSQSISAAVEAPPFPTTGRGSLAKSQPASQRDVEVQLGEPEEMGKQ